MFLSVIYVFTGMILQLFHSTWIFSVIFTSLCPLPFVDGFLTAIWSWKCPGSSAAWCHQAASFRAWLVPPSGKCPPVSCNPLCLRGHHTWWLWKELAPQLSGRCMAALGSVIPAASHSHVSGMVLIRQVCAPNTFWVSLLCTCGSQGGFCLQIHSQ